jgi:hypothetical protein
VTSIPFLNLTPWTTFGNWFSPFNRRHFFAAEGGLHAFGERTRLLRWFN